MKSHLRFWQFALLPLGFMLLSGCNGNADVEKEEPSKEIVINESGPHPKVVIEDPVHKFGAMEIGQTLTHEFVIKNEGEAPLLLIKDRSTCKCTMADFEEREVLPGESTSITLEWIGKVADDAFSQAAYIKTNDPENMEISLSVAGIVDATFEILPAGIWNLGELREEEPTPFSGSITSTVLDEFDVTDVESPSEFVTAEAVPMTEEELKEKKLKSGFVFKGEVKPGTPIGEFKAPVTMNIKFRDKVNDSRLTVSGFRSGPMQIIGPAGWNATEMLYYFGRFDRKEGKEVNLSMFLHDNEAGPLEVTKVVSEPSQLEFEMVKDEAFKGEGRERYKIRIAVPPGAPAFSYNEENPGTILVTTNHPVLTQLSFKVYMLSF